MQQTVLERRTSPTSLGRKMRIACVQGGDYWSTKRRLQANGAEYYSGQRYTVDAYERFARGYARLIVSLDAPYYAHQQGRARYRGVPRPLDTRAVPRRVSEWLRAQQIIRELERFRATHLIVRCNDLVGCELLKWAARRRIPTAGILASRFGREHRQSQRFCELANSPNVLLMANHNRVATESMVEAGMHPQKAIAWDYPPAVHPADHAPKQLPTSGPIKVLFAGRVCDDKGIPELIDACARLRPQNKSFELTICGDGPMLPELRNHPAVSAGWLTLTGLMQNAHIHKCMRESVITVVPSRHEFAEGLPLVIYESLAVRTPLVISDHPIFTRYFQNDFGVRFFESPDPANLATALASLASDPTAYARLSAETEAVWQSLACPTTFDDILQRLRKAWDL
ncbi:MAG TPA: glycosyltransferase family 4 protein [Pirellulales bacterium]|nr:glycosyltransferase family 4 protein [Pirellulales bacterium]